MTIRLDELVRSHWWSVVASVTRANGGDLGLAEDAVQEACAAALAQWAVDGPPANPLGWLISVARRKAIDHQRREARRGEKEAAAMRELGEPEPAGAPSDADDLGLIFLCCHPALDPATRIALTLRCVCGLSTSEIASALLVSESTLAKRLIRGKAKIRDTGIRFRTVTHKDLSERLPAVLKVIYLVFTEGHSARAGQALVRAELCDLAILLARSLHRLLPDDAEVDGLLALLLLTDARRGARTDAEGGLVLLEEQDRTRWDHDRIAEGESILDHALRMGRPGPYQVHAAIAACHSTAQSPGATDWRQIALLYQELVRYEPTAVVEAHRAVAVAMAEGPDAGLAILSTLDHHPQLRHWPQLHIARAGLLARGGRIDEAVVAYLTALDLKPSEAERRFIVNRIRQLQAGR